MAIYTSDSLNGPWEKSNAWFSADPMDVYKVNESIYCPDSGLHDGIYWTLFTTNGVDWVEYPLDANSLGWYYQTHYYSDITYVNGTWLVTTDDFTAVFAIDGEVPYGTVREIKLTELNNGASYGSAGFTTDGKKSVIVGGIASFARGIYGDVNVGNKPLRMSKRNDGNGVVERHSRINTATEQRYSSIDGNRIVGNGNGAYQ